MLGLFGQEVPSVVFLQLDNQQTSEHRTRDGPRYARVCPGQKEFERKARRESFRWKPAEPPEVLFRHCRWMPERGRVLSALEAANVAESRQDRFRNCGGDCLVEYSPSLQRYRLKANYCGDRFCVPCARARAKKIERALLLRCRGFEPLFVTLTLRNSSESLSVILDRLYAAFKNLRRHKLWKQRIRGGVAVVEIKRGENSGQWHVHLHAICEGSYLNARLLSDAWRAVTGDSFIVNVQRVRHADRGIGYVAKYASKGWTNEVVNDPDSLLECVVSLRGRRLILTFGTWAKLDLEDNTVVACDWKRVDLLKNVLDASERGELWAVPVMRALNAADEIPRDPGRSSAGSS